MIKLKEKGFILGVLLLALGLRIHLMTRSLFYDELYIAVHGAQAHSLFEALFKTFDPSNHLGYTALVYPTCHLLGIKEWTLRLPALLFGLGSIFLFWQWVRKYFCVATALLGAILLALAPAHIIWSASARGYSACIFFTILSSALYFSLLEKPSLKTAVMLTLTNIFASSFHVYFLCVFLAQFLHFLWISIRFFSNHGPSIKKGSIVNISLSIAGSCLGSLLIYFSVLRGLIFMARDHRALVPDFPLTLWRDLWSVPLWPLGLFCLIFMFIGFIHSNNRLLHWRVYVALLFLMVFPIWLSQPVYLYPRFFAYLLPFLFLLLANGIITIVKDSTARLRPITIFFIVLAMGTIIGKWLFLPSTIVENFKYKFRESVQFAENVASPQTRFCAFGDKDEFFQFYSHRPVERFKTFEDFKGFYEKQDQIICFTMSGPPMPQEHKKIFLFILSLPDAKVKTFDNIMVLDLKA